MGRSVSTPRNANVVYGTIHVDEFRCDNCGDTFNEYKDGLAKEGDPEWDSDMPADLQDDIKRCPHCGEHEDGTSKQGEYAYQDAFDDTLEDFKSEVLRVFESAHEDDSWLDREDHALAANRFVWFGISEYCGVVALWMAPKEAPYDSPASWEALRDNWMRQAWPKFKKLANSCVPEPMVRLGTMSNGESVYQRVNP
jgi:hypothetical protein